MKTKTLLVFIGFLILIIITPFGFLLNDTFKKKETPIQFTGYVIDKNSISDFQVLVSKQIPNKPLDEITDENLVEWNKKEITIMWIPVSEKEYNDISLFDELVITHDDQFLTSNPPIVNPINIEIKKY